tara:strand:+ start:164 stop:481 length:318 start_codon:yes stop_codon:yes gene_type:complete
MLNQSMKRSKKILVCAPSNAAIDEIVTRLISKGGLFGQNEEDSQAKVLRIGSFDYEPSKIVKKVTFDTKFVEASRSQSDATMTDEDKEKLKKNKKVWEEHIGLVE